MTTSKFTELYYDSKHPEILILLGLDDPNADGVVNSAESQGSTNAGFAEFYASLSAAERGLLNSFDAASPLRVANFRNNPDLARVALKRIIYAGERENIVIPGFPTVEELDTRLDFSLDDAEKPFVDAVVLDLSELQENLSNEQWLFITGGPSGEDVPPLVAVLRRVLSDHNVLEERSAVTFDDWRLACESLTGEGFPADAWETWGQLTTTWLGSAPWAHGPLQHAPDHAVKKLWTLVFSSVTGVYSGMGPTVDADGGRLPLIGSAAVAAYLDDPSAFDVPVAEGLASSYDGGLRSLRFEAKTVWPAHPTSVGLWDWVDGISARLEADPNASAVAWQNIKEGQIQFLPGQPLVKLSGIRFQLADESDVVADIHGKLWQAFVEEYPIFGYDIRTNTFIDDLPQPYRTDFDVEGIAPTGIVILNGRLCFTFTGEENSRDLIKPFGDDVYALDISRPLVMLLGRSPRYGSLLGAFFDAEGNVRPDVPIDVLQEAILDLLAESSQAPDAERKSSDPRHVLPDPESVVSEVRADDIEMDLSSFISDFDAAFSKYGADVSVASFGVANGRVRARYRYDSSLPQASGDWFAEGVADVELGLSAPGVSSSSGDLFTGKLYFHYDALVNRGYAKLVLPEVALRGISSQADGIYDGSVTVGIEFQGGVPGPGGYSVETLLKTIAVDAVLTIRKDHGDFFAAAVKIRDERLDDDAMRVRQLLVDNDIALFDGKTGLYGILNGGTFTQIQACDEDNRYLIDQFEIVAAHAVVGGLGNFFGDGVAVEIRHGEDGSYFIRPKLKVGSLENNYEIGLGRVGGELVVTPVKGPSGIVDHFRIEARDLSVSISDAALDMGDKHVRGKTDAVLNGTWESEAPNLAELLANGRDWRGRGTLKMTRTGNNLTVTDDGGQSFVFDTDRIDTEFSIGAIEFNPLKGRGKLTETVQHGNVTYGSERVSITTDFTGSVTVSGKYPLVRMEVLQLIADGAQNVPTEGTQDDEREATAEQIVFGPDTATGTRAYEEDVFAGVTPEEFAAAEARLILDGFIEGGFVIPERRVALSGTFIGTTPPDLMDDVMALVVTELYERGFATEAGGAGAFDGVSPEDFIDAASRLILSCPRGMAGILEAFPEMSRETFVKAVMAPAVGEMHDSSLLAVDPAFFVSEEFPMEALFASLDEVRVGIESLPVATGLVYDEDAFGVRRARYPAFKGGLLRFLNPSIQEGTVFSSADPQTIMTDGKLGAFRFDLNQPVDFIGIRFTGFGAESKPCRHGEDSLHFYAYTKHGKIDLVGLMRLFFPFKTAKLYASLKKRGMDVGRNGVPERREDFVAFLREIEKTFRVEETVGKAIVAERDAFQPDVFKKLDRGELSHVWQKIIADGPPRELPGKRDASALAAYLNGIATEPKFEDHFLERIAVFDPKTRGQAYIYLQEIRRLREYRYGEALSRAEKTEIRGYRHLVLRLLLKQYLPNNDVVDFGAAAGFIEMHGTPQRADYEWFAFEEDGDAPITASLSFRDARFRVEAATGEGETMQDVSLSILAPEFRIAGNVDSVADLQLDIGPPAENGITAVDLSFGEYDVSDLELVVMPPQAWDEPTIAILPPDGRDEGFNRAVGSGMTLTTQLDRRVSMDLNVREFQSTGGRLFVSAPVYTPGGVFVDYVDVVADLDDAVLPDVTVALRPLYDEARPHMLNSVIIDGGVGSDGGVNAVVFIGRDDSGARRYALVDDVAAMSSLSVVDQDVTLSGYARMTVKPPASLSDDPGFVALREAGIGIQIDEAVFDGTFKIAVSGGGKGEDPVAIDLTRLGEEGTAGFVPASLTVRGVFTFDVQGVNVTVTEIRVPIDAFAIEMIANDPAIADSVTRAVIKKFGIPAGGPAANSTDGVVTASVSGSVDIPSQFGIRDVRLDDASVRLSFPDGAAFSMDESGNPSFTASGGARLNVADAPARNVLDLSAGEISYVDGEGRIRKIQLNASALDLLYRTTLKAAFQGDLRLDVK